MAHEEHDPLMHPEVQNASGGAYIAAFVIALAAMCLGCVITIGVGLEHIPTLTWLAVMAAIASIGQLYLLFKLDLSEAMRWHTISLVLTAPLFVMAIGLTIFMFHYLHLRVMIGG